MGRRYTDDELRKAVAENFSIRQVLTALCIIPAGGNYATIKKHIKALGVNTQHFTGQVWNKGDQGLVKRHLNEYLSNKRAIGSHKLKRQLMRYLIKYPICESCRNYEWKDSPIPLELHHINGDHSDNSLENLQFLCPNCHALTDTYRGRNKERVETKRLPPKSDNDMEKI